MATRTSLIALDSNSGNIKGEIDKQFKTIYNIFVIEETNHIHITEEDDFKVIDLQHLINFGSM